MIRVLVCDDQVVVRDDLSAILSTVREIEVVGEAEDGARGLSNADIAARLYLSEGTVRNYVSSILAKLDVTDRTQAAVLALRYGLSGDDGP